MSLFSIKWVKPLPLRLLVRIFVCLFWLRRSAGLCRDFVYYPWSGRAALFNYSLSCIFPYLILPTCINWQTLLSLLSITVYRSDMGEELTNKSNMFSLQSCWFVYFVKLCVIIQKKICHAIHVYKQGRYIQKGYNRKSNDSCYNLICMQLLSFLQLSYRLKTDL